jgi:hypothetical protein
MTRQAIATGTTANDGTGDTLRSAGNKINANFVELYKALGGDSDHLSTQVTLEDSAVVFEGATNNLYETRLTAVDPTADRQIQLPNVSGIVVIDTATQTLTNKTLTTPTISSPKVTTAINDANSNELIKFTSVASAVNEITVTNAASGNSPIISATGTGTNLNISLNAKGTGSIASSKLALGSSEITANGAASAVYSYIICNKATALAITLADGTTTGEFKIFTNKGAGTATITPANFANGTSFAIAQNEGATCVWDGSNWFLIGNQSITTVA